MGASCWCGTSVHSAWQGQIGLKACGSSSTLTGCRGKFPGSQLSQVPSLGVEVIAYLVGCTMGQVGGRRRGREQREGEREERERKTVRGSARST